jgi:holo-[acyl-carrier protein] synthase
VIIGLGIDLADIRRIEVAMRNPRFVERILTPRERLLATTVEEVAGRWAAKEATTKALGRRVLWHHVEILSEPTGKPVLTLHESRMPSPGAKIFVSITHERQYAAAVVVIEV